LLDETLVFIGSEIGWPESHSQDNIPILLAGGGGAFKTGRALDFRKNKSDNADPGISHNNLLVSIMNLLGDPRTTVQQDGKNYCSDPITLT